jgi:hypothetical protein
VTASQIPSGKQVSTLAGDGSPALVDGPVRVAEFVSPGGCAIDAGGTILYVADVYANCIRKVTIGSTVTVATLAGDSASTTSGATNSTDPTKARFNTPRTVVIDPATGDLYVADSANNAIRKIAKSDSSVTTLAGSTGGQQDGVGAAAQFLNPSGLALDGSTLYVADTGNNMIRTVDIKTGTVATISGTKAADGTIAAGLHNDVNGAKAQFAGPFALALNSAKQLFILDSGNHRVRVLDTASPTKAVTTLVGPADSVTAAEGDTVGDGKPANGRLNLVPDGGLAVGADDTLYIVDGGNDHIYTVTAGVLAYFAGDGKLKDKVGRVGGYVEGNLLSAEFDRATGISVAADGTVYIGDNFNSRVRRIH